MGKLIIIGVSCFLIGVCVTGIFMCIVLAVKNNEYHVEELDMDKECERFENRRHSNGKER